MAVPALEEAAPIAVVLARTPVAPDGDEGEVLVAVVLTGDLLAVRAVRDETGRAEVGRAALGEEGVI